MEQKIFLIYLNAKLKIGMLDLKNVFFLLPQLQKLTGSV